MSVRSRGRRGVVQHSAEHYRQRRKRLVEKGTVKKEHADSTKENIWGVMKKMDKVGD